VENNIVEIDGTLDHQELNCFLELFRQKGFDQIDNIILSKSDPTPCHKNVHEILLEEEQKKNAVLQKKVSDLEILMKSLLEDEHRKQKILQEEKERILRDARMQILANNPKSQEILSDFDP
jgi:hypothetical protein